jgi:hypothetical protein
MYTPVIICTIDKLPYEVSPCYKTLVEEHGLAYAAQWTETVDIPLSKEPDG